MSKCRKSKYYDGTRSEEVRKPIPNIWGENRDDWDIIYDYDDVKIYKRVGS